MISANQIAEFLHELFPQSKLNKQLHFYHADKNSQKLKID